MALLHLYEVSKLLEKEVEWWLPEAGRWEKLVDVGHRVQTSHSNMNKFWGLNA